MLVLLIIVCVSIFEYNAGYHEWQWVQSLSGYLEPWLYNTWDGNL